MIFEDNKNCMECVVNRIISGLQPEVIHICGSAANLSGLYVKPEKVRVQKLQEITHSSLVLLFYETIIPQEDIAWIQEHSKQTNILVYSRVGAWEIELCKISNAFCNISRFSGETGNAYFVGPLFGNGANYVVPVGFKVLAIVHVYNEVDIIASTIEYLLSQEVDLYLVDNWSDDGSYEIMMEYAKRFNKRITVERFPVDGKKEYYDWYHQLERTEQLNRELEYNWFIHYDTDEMRISPWKGMTLRQFIFHVDRMGYNVIDNTVIDFKLTSENQTESIFMKDTWFDFGHRAGHFQQRKTWKKAAFLELKSSGGHMAIVDNPKVFPLKILNRHYPMRTVEQAKKKIFLDRAKRFEKEQQERGWHQHYNSILQGKSFVEDKSNLLLWEEEAVNTYYIPLFFGIGIRKDFEEYEIILNKYDLTENDSVIIYGAGKVGRSVYKALAETYNITLWVDQNYLRCDAIFGERIENPDRIFNVYADKIIIAIENEEIANEVRIYLERGGVETKKIIWENIIFK